MSTSSCSCMEPNQEWIMDQMAMFFDLLQLLRGFLYWKDHLKKKKNGQVLNKPQMRLLLKISGGTFYQIQTDI